MAKGTDITDTFSLEQKSAAKTSPAGAGDGVLAGTTLAYSRKESLETGLLDGFALAAAILKTLPTADFIVS